MRKERLKNLVDEFYNTQGRIIEIMEGDSRIMNAGVEIGVSMMLYAASNDNVYYDKIIVEKNGHKTILDKRGYIFICDDGERVEITLYEEHIYESASEDFCFEKYVALEYNEVGSNK